MTRCPFWLRVKLQASSNKNSKMPMIKATSLSCKYILEVTNSRLAKEAPNSLSCCSTSSKILFLFPIYDFSNIVIIYTLKIWNSMEIRVYLFINRYFLEETMLCFHSNPDGMSLIIWQIQLQGREKLSVFRWP